MKTNGKGNLSSDVEMVTTTTGKRLAKFSIACNKKGKDDKDEVNFFNVIVVGYAAEYAERYKKGDFVMLEGELKQETWKDRDSGANRSTVKIIAFDVALIKAKNHTAEAHTSEETQEEDAPF